MIKVVVSSPKSRIERYGIKPPEGFELVYINNPYTEDELIEKSKDATFLFLSLSPASRNVINKLKTVKLIQSEGAGYDGIDTEAAKEAGIYVCNASGVNKVAVAEHTIGLILASLRRTVEADRQIKKGNFEENYRDYEVRGMRELQSCHIGLVGLGNIGKEVVKRLKPFNCKISYYDPFRKPIDVETDLGIDYLPLGEILRKCDVISLHVPLMPETENLINKDTINLMRKDAILINTARGGIINQEDLARALIENRIEGAAVDTINPQPPHPEHPLLNLPEEAASKLILTTHIAGITTEAFKKMQIIAWNSMMKVLNGEKPDNIVNGL